MTRSRRLLVLICAALATALAAPPALAAGNAIINDCQSNGQLTHPYTVKQLRHALSVMPASVKQYTSCFDVVQNALVSAGKHNGIAPVGGSNGGGGSSFLPTPVIIVLVILILAALTFGALAIRRRRGEIAGGEAADGSAYEPSAGSDEPSAEAPTRVDERPEDERPTRVDTRPEDERP